ncbi:hypothetical protein K8O92_10055 [Nocardia asteroides]|nr:hypothetical protein K8O92_10055 [Nocardia asteroides]
MITLNTNPRASIRAEAVIRQFGATHPEDVTRLADTLAAAARIPADYAVDYRAVAAAMGNTPPSEWDALLADAAAREAKHAAAQAVIGAGLKSSLIASLDATVTSNLDHYLAQLTNHLDTAERTLVEHAARVPNLDPQHAVDHGYGDSLTAVYTAARTISLIASVLPTPPSGTPQAATWLEPPADAGHVILDAHALSDRIINGETGQLGRAAQNLVHHIKQDPNNTVLAIARGQHNGFRIHVPRSLAETRARYAHWADINRTIRDTDTSSNRRGKRVTLI